MPPHTPLPPPRLITTAHTPSGTSIIATDAPHPIFSPFGPHASSFTRLHSRPAVPASNTTTSPPDAPSQTLPRCPPRGVLFCTTDIPPGTAAPMHRTLSVDYIVVIAGEIVLRLDGGEERTVGVGECVVQGGVNHEWENRGEGVCRMVVVMVASEVVVLGDGRELGETVFMK